MSEEKIVEHHYHDPTQGQVMKAMYQYLADQGVTTKKLEEVVGKKLEEAVQKRINQYLSGPHFDEVVLSAVMKVVAGEKDNYGRDSRSYGLHNRIRDLVNQELQRTILADYKVTVTKKEAT